MSAERDLLERSLYFLEPSDWEEDSDTSRTCIKLSREIQQLLTQPEQTEQEPVAWLHEGVDETGEPVKREPLSDEAIRAIVNQLPTEVNLDTGIEFCKIIEKAHGIGEDDKTV